MDANSHSREKGFLVAEVRTNGTLEIEAMDAFN